jgi:putative component of toxin-antitoxin plasmid stabilization module
MEQGNFSNVKGVGAGAYEYRIDFDPDYRIYYGKDGDRLVILRGWYQEAPGNRYCCRKRALARLDCKRWKRQEV